MAPKSRLQRITLFLVKEGVSADAVWSEDLDDEPTEFAVGRSLRGRLAIGPNKTKTPSWVAYLRPHLNEAQLDKLRNSSTAAAMAFEAAGRTFVASFGYGRFLIRPEVVEPDFGLKVAVNTIEPDQLKSVDARGYEELTLHTQRDVSRESSISAFEMDVSKDVVRSITGSPLTQPGEEELARRLSGADALALNTRVQLPELPDLCGRLLEAYGSQRYKERFGFIDFLRRVTDKAEKVELDQLLVEALRERDLDDLHMAIPETIDWLAVSGVRFSTEGAEALHTDPPVSAYLRTREPDELTLERLKSDRVLAISAETDQPMGKWSVYRCIVYETKREQRLYVLSAGEWFWVSQSYADEVTQYARELPELDVELPAAEAGIQEDAYNRVAAEATRCLCLDRQFVTKSVPDRTEICDLLSRERQLIHIKKRGASSTLGHLFNQGLNSAEWMLEDAGFRAEAREVAIALDPEIGQILPQERPEPSDYEVSFVVITRSTRDSPLTLPFFSLVSLRNVARRLRGRGFKVSAKKVQEARLQEEEEG